MAMSPLYLRFVPSTPHEHPCQIHMSPTRFWGLQYVDPTWMLVGRSADVAGKRKDGALRFRRAQRSRSQVAY